MTRSRGLCHPIHNLFPDVLIRMHEMSAYSFSKRNASVINTLEPDVWFVLTPANYVSVVVLLYSVPVIVASRLNHPNRTVAMRTEITRLLVVVCMSCSSCSPSHIKREPFGRLHSPPFYLTFFYSLLHQFCHYLVGSCVNVSLRPHSVLPFVHNRFKPITYW